jgi:hypothetical protein
MDSAKDLGPKRSCPVGGNSTQGIAEQATVNFSDLPESDRDLIAAAELEAESILEAGQRARDLLVSEAYDLGVDPSGIGFSPGTTLLELAHEKDAQGRQEAANYLFGVAVLLYWKLLKPDVAGFSTKLDLVWRRVSPKFQLSTEIPNRVKREWHAWALRERSRMVRSDATHSTLKLEPADDAERQVQETLSGQPSSVNGANTGNSMDQRVKAKLDGEPLEPAVALNVTLIKTWMDHEGWTVQTLAERLSTSERAISSIRNNGKYHGRDAVIKLANLMKRDVEDLYQP